MLMEEDLLALSTLVSKLQIEGYDVATLKEILKKERKKLNERQAEDLKLYFSMYLLNLSVRQVYLTSTASQSYLRASSATH